MEIQDTTDLMRESYPPIRWAVDGLIPEGITVFAAPWKAGKSWIMNDCGIGVASGTHALGRLSCTAGPVLYCALEDSPRRAQQRVRMALGDRPEPVELHWAYDMPTVANGGLGDIAQWLDDHPDAGLVIVDVLARIRGDIPQTYQRDYDLVNSFKNLSDQHNRVPIVLVTHTNKHIDRDDPTSSIQGSKGLTSASDTILMMMRDRGSEVATLLMTGKDVPDAMVPLALSDGRWVVTRETAEHRGITGARGQLIDALNDPNVGDSGAALAMATGLTEDHVRQLLRRMLKAHQVVKDRAGNYRAA